MLVKFNAGVMNMDGTPNKNGDAYSPEAMKKALDEKPKMPVFSHDHKDLGHLQVEEVDSEFNITGDLEFEANDKNLEDLQEIFKAMKLGKVSVQMRGLKLDDKFEPLSVGVMINES